MVKIATLTVCDFITDPKKGDTCANPASVVVNLTVDGTPMVLDLCSTCAQTLVPSARKAGPTASSFTRPAKTTGIPTSQVRLWANEHSEAVEMVMGADYKVPAKGRMPQQLVDAWRAASSV